MPREAFFKLKEEKRKQIMDASLKEFVSKPIQEVSINKIIEDADISRGSFYLYFENLEDLHQYFLSFVRKHIVNTLKAELNGTQSIFEIALKLFDKAVDILQHEELAQDKQIVTRLAKELNPMMIMYFVQGFDDENPLIFTKISDFKKLNIRSASDFQIIIEILIAYTSEKVCEVFVDYTPVNEARNNLVRMFEYLKKSFYK